MNKSLNKIPSTGSFNDFEWSFQSDNSILILKKTFFTESGNDLEIGMCNLNGLDFNGKVGIPSDFEQMTRPRQHHHAARRKCKKIVGQRLIPPTVVLLPSLLAHLLPLE